MSAQTDVFWGEIAPSEHLLQIYEHDGVFLDSLERFTTGGLRTGEAVVVIATAKHLHALEDRLATAGLDIVAARSRDEFISLDAEQTLATFMVNNWPDEARFEQVIGDILLRARGPGRQVRAFGEMVAVLWARGQNGATVHLEHLWQQLCEREAFSLFCAYPKIGFTQEMSAGLSEICAAHSRVIDGAGR